MNPVPKSIAIRRSYPRNLWPSDAAHCVPDLRWLIDNQAQIVRASKAKTMHTPRPIKLWSDGRVRVEFVGTFKSATVAREVLSQRIIDEAERISKQGSRVR